MAAWSALYARLRGLVRRDVVSDEIREELDFHVGMRAEEYERRGDTREAAKRRALARVGNLAVMQDRGYDVRGGGVVETIIQDIRYGVRLLWKDRGFSAVALVTLALGIGMSTALASVIDAALLNPLPYPHPEQLMHVLIEEPGHGRYAPSVEDVRALASASHAVAGFAVWRGIFTPPITDADVPERLSGMEISEGYLPLYGVSPLIGRGITADDMRDGAAPVLLIGYDYWQHAYAGRADALGTVMQFDDGIFTIVGVLPKTFHRATPIWRPLRLTPFVFSKRGLGTDVEVRLAPGAALDAAQRELANILSRGPDWKAGSRIQLSSLVDAEVRQSATTSRVLTGAVGLILLIACVNVAGLLLARGSARVSELAVRTAIGAGRGRLIRQLLTESLVLALLGGLAGVLVAWWSLDAIVANLPLSLPSDAPPTINGPVLAFTAGLAIVTGLAFGLVPAVRLSRVRFSNDLARGSRRAGSALSRRGGQLLIAIETMLAIVLLAGAGLMLRSFDRMLSVNLGFKPDSFVTLEATPVTKDPAAFATYYRSLVDRVRLIPGVSAAGAIDHLPLRGSSRFGAVTSSALRTGPASFANTRRVLPGYFEAMGFTPAAGRFPTAADLDAGRHVAVLNLTEAKALFPGAPPTTAVGQSITVGKDETEVIGIVPDIEFWGVPLSPMPRTCRTLKRSRCIGPSPTMRIGSSSSRAQTERCRRWPISFERPRARRGRERWSVASGRGPSGSTRRSSRQAPHRPADAARLTRPRADAGRHHRHDGICGRAAHAGNWRAHGVWRARESGRHDDARRRRPARRGRPRARRRRSVPHHADDQVISLRNHADGRADVRRRGRDTGHLRGACRRRAGTPGGARRFRSRRCAPSSVCLAADGVDPGQRRLERRVVPGRQRRGRQRHDDVRRHAAAFDAAARRRDEVAERIHEHVAIGQTLRDRRQCLSHRRPPEHPNASEALERRGKALGRAAGELVDQHRDWPGKRLHARGRPP